MRGNARLSISQTILAVDDFSSLMVHFRVSVSCVNKNSWNLIPFLEVRTFYHHHFKKPFQLTSSNLMPKTSTATVDHDTNLLNTETITKYMKGPILELPCLYVSH